MDKLELLLKALKKGSEQQLNETISKGALKMSDQQITTVSFAFWLVFMAETDLNDITKKAWTLSGLFYSPEETTKAKLILTEMVGGKRSIDIDNLEYFSDKIKIYQAMFGENDRTKLLWKLNTIRNDLSHNRINELQYDKHPLFERETKEKILTDYFATALASDISQSEFWNSLSKTEQDKAKQTFIEARNKGLI